MSEKLPYFPLYVDDFMSSSKVELMPTDGVGAYVFLLCRAWREIPAGSLPNDDAILAKWGRVTADRWLDLKPVVMAAFKLGTDGRFHQVRMRTEYEKAKKLYSGRRKGALNAAAQKRCNGSSANAERPLSTLLAGAGESGSGSISITERSEVKEALPVALDTDAFRACWERWKKHRKEKREKLTPSTTKAQLKKLEAWGASKAIASLEQSIEKGWIGFFEPDAKASPVPFPARPQLPNAEVVLNRKPSVSEAERAAHRALFERQTKGGSAQ